MKEILLIIMALLCLDSEIVVAQGLRLEFAGEYKSVPFRRLHNILVEINKRMR